MLYLAATACLTLHPCLHAAEKSRVVGFVDCEQSYHVFYQLLSADPDTQRALRIPIKATPDFFAYLRGTPGVYAAAGSGDEGAELCGVRGWNRTLESLSTLGVDECQQQ